MRVIAGEFRGRPLVAPPGSTTRPTSDRVRESIFNSLGSLGALDGEVVLDLFAGSGAMGIEALSRGMARAVFVESDRSAAQTISRNLSSLGLADRASVVVSPVERYLDRQGEIDTYSLVLVDPPYAYDQWAALAAMVHGDWLVAESDREVELGPGWRIRRQRTTGGTVVSIASADGPEPVDPQERLQ